VLVIEPSAAVARQVQRVLAARALLAPHREGGGVLYLCSGDEAAFARTRAALAPELDEGAVPARSQGGG
jgi:hypothetical protein